MRNRFKKLSLALLFLLIVLSALYLIPLPPSFMGRLLSGHAAYYFQDEEDWLQETALPEVLWVKLLEFKARHDLKERIAQQANLSADAPAASIAAAAHAARMLYINQLQEEVPIISNSTIASLLRGVGYCDQVNGFLALLLTDYLPKVQLWGLKNEQGVSPHALVRSESALGVVWIDAFYCMKAYGFNGAFDAQNSPHISAHDKEALALYPAAYYEQGFFINEYTFSHTASKLVTRFRPVLHSAITPAAASAKKGPVKKGGIAMAENKAQQLQWLTLLRKESPAHKKMFIQARVQHLYGNYPEALSLYRQLKEASPNGLLAKYATIFEGRITGNQQPCH